MPPGSAGAASFARFTLVSQVVVGRLPPLMKPDPCKFGPTESTGIRQSILVGADESHLIPGERGKRLRPSAT